MAPVAPTEDVAVRLAKGSLGGEVAHPL